MKPDGSGLRPEVKSVSPTKLKDFKEVYERSCALNGVHPLKIVTTFLDDNILDVNVDKLDKTDWLPLIESLRCRHKLQFLALRSLRNHSKRFEIRTTKRMVSNDTSRTEQLHDQVMAAMASTLCTSSHLTCLELQNLPLRESSLSALSSGLANNKTLQHLSLYQCPIKDLDLEVICKALKNCLKITSINLSQCSLTWKAAGILAAVVKHQTVERRSNTWHETLRNSLANLDSMGGLQRITLNGNPMLGDKGAEILGEMLVDDIWLKAIDLQDCGIRDKGAGTLLKSLKQNTTLFILDIRRNFITDRDILLRISQQLSFNTQGQTTQFKWFKVPSVSDKSRRLKGNGMRERGIPWRVAARLSAVGYPSAGHLPGIANMLVQSKPSLVGFSADDKTETGSSRSSNVAQRRLQGSNRPHNIIKAIQSEISQVRELLSKEKELRFEAEKRIAMLSSENEKLRQDFTYMEEVTLAMVEATFKKFNSFLQMLRKEGYGNGHDENEAPVHERKEDDGGPTSNVIEQRIKNMLDASFKDMSLQETTSPHNQSEYHPSPSTANRSSMQVAQSLVLDESRRQSASQSQKNQSSRTTTTTSRSSHYHSKSDRTSSTLSFSKLSTSSPGSLASIITQSDKF